MTRPVLAQGATFALVGLAATAVHVVVALAVRQAAGASALEANFAGYAAAVTTSYVGNARFTFGQPIWRTGQFLRFLTVSLACLALNQATTWLLVNRLHWRFGLALAVVVVVVAAASFLLSRLWSFRASGGD
ncbi:MAG: GtrA family protein [Phenylobacterium sp.]